MEYVVVLGFGLVLGYAACMVHVLLTAFEDDDNSATSSLGDEP